MASSIDLAAMARERGVMVVGEAQGTAVWVEEAWAAVMRVEVRAAPGKCWAAGVNRRGGAHRDRTSRSSDPNRRHTRASRT